MITVVIPCYNQGKFLRTALDSLLVQTRRDWEAVVVNDASTDDTAAIVNEVIESNPSCRIALLDSDTNEGLSRSRNEAIARSSGEYILPLDADDFLHPLYLKATAKVLDDNLADICAANRMNFGMQCGFVNTDNPDISIQPLINQIGYCSLFRRTVWEKAGGYPDNAGREGAEDMEFWIKCSKAKCRIANVGETLWYYRVRPDSMAKRAAEDNDYVMARMVTRHPELYSQESIKRAFSIIEQESQDEDSPS